MAISFKYKAVSRPDGTEVKIPSVPILLKGKESFETMALLDSGADISAIPKSVAELLDLNLSGNSSPAFGIGGAVDAVDTTMAILVQKAHERYTMRIPVKVILGDYDFPVLLGRAGFFDKFKITFHQLNEKIVLKRES